MANSKKLRTLLVTLVVTVAVVFVMYFIGHVEAQAQATIISATIALVGVVLGTGATTYVTSRLHKEQQAAAARQFARVEMMNALSVLFPKADRYFEDLSHYNYQLHSGLPLERDRITNVQLRELENAMNDHMDEVKGAAERLLFLGSDDVRTALQKFLSQFQSLMTAIKEGGSDEKVQRAEYSKSRAGVRRAISSQLGL